MKKVMLCMIVCFTLVSCNNDDTNTQINLPEKIIGEWSLNRKEINGVLEDLEVCELLTTIQFFENGNFDIELFIGDDVENCQSASNNGLWEYLQDDRITIQLSEQSEATMFRISFSNNYNTLILIQLHNEEIVSLEEYIRQ